MASAGVTQEALQRALELAYRYLNRRERCTAEVRGHLLARDFEPEVTARALAELAELGVIDDARYARLLCEDKRALQGWGEERIRRLLRERGIDRELIESALAESAGDGELPRALELLRRRFPVPPVDRRDRERALGMMVRKGFETELALDALVAYARESHN